MHHVKNLIFIKLNKLSTEIRVHIHVQIIIKVWYIMFEMMAQFRQLNKPIGTTTK